MSSISIIEDKKYYEREDERASFISIQKMNEPNRLCCVDCGSTKNQITLREFMMGICKTCGTPHIGDNRDCTTCEEHNTNIYYANRTCACGRKKKDYNRVCKDCMKKICVLSLSHHTQDKKMKK